MALGSLRRRRRRPRRGARAARAPAGRRAGRSRPSRSLRCGIAATQVHVDAAETDVVRTAAAHRRPDRGGPAARAGRAPGPWPPSAALAEAEGRLHRRPPEQVHFHEVGGLDAIVDVVGTCAALEVLGVDEVRASPVATGTGMVRAAHGMLPNPAPAVVELLAGAPTYGRRRPRRAHHAHRRRPARRAGVAASARCRR